MYGRPNWSLHRPRLRSTVLALAVLAAASTLPACGTGHGAGESDGWPRPVRLASSWAPRPEEVGGLERVAHAYRQQLLLRTAGGVMDFVPGVDIGATVPGRSPGEVYTEAADYARWFRRIGDLGLRAVRVYTIMRPQFYDELAAYNRAHADAPLYLLHGVWVPEDELLASEDVWSAAVVDGMRAELGRVVDVVRGKARLPKRAGHASGRYTSNVTPWMLGWSIGIEWEAPVTAASDAKNAGRPPYAGRYVTATPDATPTESWLAAMMDDLASRLAGHGLTMPLSFVNWPTTDPLRHPAEPNPREDLVSVDANHAVATEAWPAGVFATYHLYPHYPDFQKYEAEYQTYERDGTPDPYAGYLRALKAHHAGMPVVVTEYGSPSSVGMAHRGPRGRSQGGLDERQAMRNDADLLRVVHEVGMAGGFVFEWVDEWFKLTWNTFDLEKPVSRRPMWKNAWNNEQNFGLVSTEPGDVPRFVLDGSGSEWDESLWQKAFGKKDEAGSTVVLDDDGPLAQVRVAHDEAWLHMLLRFRGKSVPWPVTLAFDVVPGGNESLPGTTARTSGADVAITLPARGPGRAFVAASNDPFSALWLSMFDAAADTTRGVEALDDWSPQKLALSRPIVVPTTGEAIPFDSFAVGEMARGPARDDSRNLWASRGNEVELRIPWASLLASDPSSKLGIVVRGGKLQTVPIETAGIAVVVDDKAYVTQGYEWQPWTTLRWHERPKAGLSSFRDAVADILEAEAPR